MNDEKFNDNLQFGNKFETRVSEILAKIFHLKDPLSNLINLASSKTDKKNRLGQRVYYNQNIINGNLGTVDSCMAPDFMLFHRDEYGDIKQTLIEVKAKSHWYQADGKTMAVVDVFKVKDYQECVKVMGFNNLLFVFGDESTGDIYLSKLCDAHKIRIPLNRKYDNRRNPESMFYAWELSDMQYIGKW